MEGRVSIDLTSVPNIIAFAGAVVGITLSIAVITAFIIKKLKVVSFGPIRLYQQNQTIMHHMNDRIRDLDDICKKNMRQITNNMKIALSGIFVDYHVCALVRVALASVIRFPLYESIMNNHFTIELMPANYASYRERVINSMKDEYFLLARTSKESSCKKGSLPSWNTVSKKIVACIDSWLSKIGKEVLDTCERKIDVYETYLVEFKAAEDVWYIGIVVKCIEKNKQYATALRVRV